MEKTNEEWDIFFKNIKERLYSIIAIVLCILFIVYFLSSCLEAVYCKGLKDAYNDLQKVQERPQAKVSMNPNLFKEKQYATVTMYSAIETCDPQNCINARGTNPKPNYSVACPRKFPFGTRVIIGGNEYVCDDRTTLRYDGRFDIFAGYTQEDYQREIEFGKQNLEVIIK